MEFFSRKRVRKVIRLVHPDFEVEDEIEFAPVTRLPESVPVERLPGTLSEDKGLDLEDNDFLVDDFQLPRWDPTLGFGDGSGSSNMPLPNFDDFFEDIPDHPCTPPIMEEAERLEIVTETSRVINGVSSSNSFTHLLECIFVFFFEKIRLRFLLS